MNSICQCKPLLGTYVEIQLHADADDDTLLDLSLTGFAEIERIQRLMSFHDPESELTRINQAAHLAPIEISADMQKVMQFALELSAASDGFFDPTIAPELIRRGLLPAMRDNFQTSSNWQAIQMYGNMIYFDAPLCIDLGGIAKGYAVDRALAVMGHDVDATINAGGDLAMTRWQGRVVEIRTPGSGGRETMKFPMENRSLATSAAYFLQSQQAIIDPHDPQKDTGKRSVSVFAESCMVADALTKLGILISDPSGLLERFQANGIMIGLEGSVKRF